jgi:MOSC domain-containing protein YiiM
MKTQILSLNIGQPELMVWGDKQVYSSMHKKPVQGPLRVTLTNIEGDSFAHNVHGTVDSVIYIYAVQSALEFLKRIGKSEYQPGALGENITVSEFDETQISIGDVFQIGSVKAQATYPRIPCGKVNIRMQHPEGQKQMIQSGRSGVYFKILEPGMISLQDKVERIEERQNKLLISDVYRITTSGQGWTEQEIEMAFANGYLSKKILDRLRQQ